MLQSDNHWPDFCRAIGKPELENDARFDTMETREQNCEEMVRILDDIFNTKNIEEWEKCLRENDCIYARVQTQLEVTTDPQAVANNFFADIVHPIGGEMKLVTTPINFSQNPASIRTHAPEIGQHTEEILLGLEYNWDNIVELKEQGVIL